MKTNFSKGPKDMLDAGIAAFTVYEFLHGRGTKVGGQDNMGTIILPRPVKPSHIFAFFDYP
jgi:hypothetical protein